MALAIDDPGRVLSRGDSLEGRDLARGGHAGGLEILHNRVDSVVVLGLAWRTVLLMLSKKRTAPHRSSYGGATLTGGRLRFLRHVCGSRTAGCKL